MDEGPASVLVIKPSSFGDVVHALPAVSLLKRAWPQTRLTWLINTEWLPLIEGNPDIDVALPFPRHQFHGARGGFRFLRWSQRNLGKIRPELALDLQGLLRSAWMGRASHPGCFVGMSDAREGARWFYDQRIDVGEGVQHAVDRCLTAARGAIASLGGRIAHEQRAIFRLPPGEAPSKTEKLPDDYILLHPFARGEGKSLNVEQIQWLCRRWSPRSVLLVGRSGTNAVRSLPANCRNLLDQTSLAELIWLIHRAALVVTVDSGPSHLVASTGRPMVAIHTWSDPRKVGPYRDDAWVWKNGRLLPMSEMRPLPDAFFKRPPPSLEEANLDAIAKVATSF